MFQPVLMAAVSDAAASGFDVASVIKDMVDNVSSQAFSALAVVVPAIGIIVGAGVAVKYGISWIRKIRA